MRGVDPTEMVEIALEQPAGAGNTRKGRVLETNELSSVFGTDIDMDGVSADGPSNSTRPAKSARRTAKARNQVASAGGNERNNARKAKPKKVTSKKTGAKKAAPKTSAAKKTARKPARKKAAAKTSTARK